MKADQSDSMATGAPSMDGGESLRYPEYSSNTNVRSETDIDRRLVRSFMFNNEYTF